MAVTQFTTADLIPAMEALAPPEHIFQHDVLPRRIVFHRQVLPG